MTAATKAPDVTACSVPKRENSAARPTFLLVLGLLYALVLQIGLGGLIEASRVAAFADVPAKFLLCQPGRTADAPAGPSGDHSRHDDTCCLASCASRLADGPLPAVGADLVHPSAFVVASREPVPEGALPGRPALHPLNSRGPPLEA